MTRTPSALGHLGPLQGAEKNFLLVTLQEGLYLMTGLPRIHRPDPLVLTDTL